MDAGTFFGAASAFGNQVWSGLFGNDGRHEPEPASVGVGQTMPSKDIWEQTIIEHVSPTVPTSADVGFCSKAAWQFMHNLNSSQEIMLDGGVYDRPNGMTIYALAPHWVWS